MRNSAWIAGIAGIGAFVGLVVTLGQPVLAQVGGKTRMQVGQRRGAGQLKKLAAYLGLSEAQKARIKPLLKDRMQQVRAIRSNTQLTPAQKTAQIKAVRQASRQPILAVLTPNQRAKLVRFWHQRRNSQASPAAVATT